MGRLFFYLEKSSSSATVNDYVNRSRRNVAFILRPPPLPPATSLSFRRTSHAHLQFTSTPRHTPDDQPSTPLRRHPQDQVFFSILSSFLVLVFFFFSKSLPLGHPSYHDLLLLLLPTISDDNFSFFFFLLQQRLLCGFGPSRLFGKLLCLPVFGRRISPYRVRVDTTRW